MARMAAGEAEAARRHLAFAFALEDRSFDTSVTALWGPEKVQRQHS